MVPRRGQNVKRRSWDGSTGWQPGGGLPVREARGWAAQRRQGERKGRTEASPGDRRRETGPRSLVYGIRSLSEFVPGAGPEKTG